MESGEGGQIFLISDSNNVNDFVIEIHTYTYVYGFILKI